MFGVAASLAGGALPRRARVTSAAALTVVAAGFASSAAVSVLSSGRAFRASLPAVLPVTGFSIALDSLGAFFMLIVALVSIPAAVYGIGYAAHGPSARTFHAVFPAFVVSMLLVPAAGDVASFLALWETMALASLLLVAAEHRHRTAAREAAHWYGAMTQLGFIAILIALFVFSRHAGGDSFAVLRAAGARMSPGVRSGVFLLALAGFGSKAGMVPLHVWLPRAHPEAPSQVSALMSGAMVKLGIYGIVRVGFDLLGLGPRWWGVVLLAAGAVSALFGVLHAMVSSDLKRLLAYSTTENVGLILIGLGASLLFAASGASALAGVAAAAALLHALNHAAFKGLLFLGAGAVQSSAGTRDLDRLGGLVRRMPVTATLFGVGALAIAALPPLNGFVSEWLLLQSLIRGASRAGVALAVSMPVAVAAVALTTGLAAATFVKAFGVGFLAQPRSREAAEATEAPVSMRVGMAMLALVCVALGFGPALAGPALGTALRVLPWGGREPLSANGALLALDGIRSSIAPVVIAVGLAAGVVAAMVVVRAFGSRRRRVAANWACGRTVQTARMEYTATSYAEPLMRVFDDVLRPDRDLDVTHRVESRYFVESVRFRTGIRDAFEQHFYVPVVRWIGAWGRAARAMQSGSVHHYLAYGFVALVVVLVIAR